MLTFGEVVENADLLMGVKAVWGRSAEPVMCFGSHGDAAGKDRGHFSLARRTAELAVNRPYLLTIGGGAHAPADMNGRVLELVRVSKAYGETKAFVRDPDLLSRLAQWPVAVVLTEVYGIEDEPHLMRDLDFEDRRILANAFDGVRRDDERVESLWAALRHRPIRRRWEVPFLPDFFDPPAPRLCGSDYPKLRLSAEEGRRIRKETVLLERDRTLSLAVKEANRARNGGVIVCEACGLADAQASLFDAHHRMPMAHGERVSSLDMFAVLCPTCHRWAHEKATNRLYPLQPEKVSAARALQNIRC